MNWLKKLFGRGSKRKSSSRSKSRHKSKSKSKSKSRSKPRQVRRKSADSTTAKSKSRNRKSITDTVKPSRRKAAKQESGQTFSNAFSHARRELPGIREADAAFRPQIRRTFEAAPDDETVDDRSVPVSLGQAGSGRSPGIRRPN